MKNKLKVLTIIGGRGFLGKSIVDYAIKKGLLKWKINKIISISRSKFFIKNKKNFKIKYVVGDISKLKKLPSSDYIIYAANSKNNKKNLKAIKNFSFLLKKLSKKTKILFTSSGAIYGDIKNKKKYAQNKIKIERIFKNYGFNGYKVSIARLFTFMGERILDDKRYAISDFVNSGFYKKKILVKSKHVVYRSYMYSYDMVRWLMSILVNSSTKCPIYNVGSDEVISLHALAKIIGKIFKKPVEIRKINRKKIEKYVPSIKKAQKELNLKINYKLKPSLYSIIKQRYKQRN